MTLGVQFSNLPSQNNELRSRPVCFMLAVGHCGNDWLHSLFDSHPQILTLPLFNFFDVWRLNFCDRIKTPEDMFLSWEKYIRGEPDRHQIRQQLLHGPEENEIFFSIFRERLSSRGISQIEVFWSILQAYAAAKNVDISKIRSILVQEHFPFAFETFSRDFPNFRVLMLMRDPRAALAGGLKAAANKWGHVPDYHYNINLERWLFGQDLWIKLKDKMGESFKVVKNEDLNGNLEYGMRELACWLGIEFSETLLQSSLFGKPWGMEGESAYIQPNQKITEQGKDFFSPEKVRLRWKTQLSSGETAMIELLLRRFMNKFNYPCDTGDHVFWKIYGFCAFVSLPRGLFRHWLNSYPAVQEFDVVARHLKGKYASILWNYLPSPVKLISIIIHSMLVRTRFYYFPKYRGTRYG